MEAYCRIRARNTSSTLSLIFHYVQVEDARRLVTFAKQDDVDTQGAEFNLVDELEVSRDRFFGRQVRCQVILRAFGGAKTEQDALVH